MSGGSKTAVNHFQLSVKDNRPAYELRKGAILQEQSSDVRGCGDVSLGGGELGQRSWSSKSRQQKGASQRRSTLDAEAVVIGVRAGVHGAGTR